jgi:type I restriction enzyme S subunit
MNKQWPTEKLGALLKRSESTTEPATDTEYKEITVRLWGKGVVERGRVTGASLTVRRYIARAGQFIASRIDARNGAMGIVPPSLEGALVTSDFPLFNLNTARIEPAFLGWLCRTPGFVELCRRASEGTTNRVRLKEDRFLALDISLPSLEEQKRLVARIGHLAAQIQEAQSIRNLAADEVDALVVSNHIQLAGDRKRRLGQILRLDEDAVRIQPEESYPQVGVKSFGGGLFAKSAISGTETTYRAFNRLFDGAIVLSQVKGWEGAVAVCPKSLAGWFVSPEYRTFRCFEGEALPGYLAPLVRTEWFWSHLIDATRGVGARRERTRPEQFLDIELPMPDLPGQRIGERAIEEIGTLKSFQAETAAELDALLPSVLSKAFGGEL